MMKNFKKNRTMLFAVCVLSLFLLGTTIFAEDTTNITTLKVERSLPVQTLPAQTIPTAPVNIYKGSPQDDKPHLTQEQLEAIAIQPAKSRTVIPALLPLFKEESITYNDGTKYNGKTLKYRLHTPKNFEADKKYPLILWLHGVGETGDDNKMQLIHLHHIITYLTGKKERDFFLLVPQAPHNHAIWENYTYTLTLDEESSKRIAEYTPKEKDKYLETMKSNTFGGSAGVQASFIETDGKISGIKIGESFADVPFGYVFAMLDQVLRDYPVDRDCVTVSGLSSGGDGTWRALEARPDLFAAAVPLVSWSALNDDAIAAHPVLKKIPIWAIYSSDDNNVDSARADFERVANAGCNVKKSEFGVCGHNAWTPAMLQADIFSWLLSRGKKNGEYVAVTNTNVDPDDLRGIVEVATRNTTRPTLAPTPPQTVQPKIFTTQSPSVVIPSIEPHTVQTLPQTV
jgi:predicted esterase